MSQLIVGMASTHDGGGYWLVASDGGIFTYGDAGYYGSSGGATLYHPIVGMFPTFDDHGYVLVSSSGGTLDYGDAVLFGLLVLPSLGVTVLNQPIVGLATG